MTDWQPPQDQHGFSPGAERAPWLRWAAGIIALTIIAAGAIWLMSKIIIPKELPVNEKPAAVKIDIADTEIPATVKKLTDAEAWVRALEKDTLEGYREYLSLFPKGKHQKDAQAEIDKYDHKDWQTAEQRDTISGYEDYLESWPEGRHASEARERIAALKARADALAKDAAERAAQETADWESAARTNTIEAYRGFLTKHPAGEHASEASERIKALKALEADEAAWRSASELNTAGAYKQYLTSFPQGTHVADAMAAIENLRPAPGRTFKDCQECPLLVSIPSGNATLGATDADTDAKPTEKPARPVTFTNMFAMGVTEVTFAEYQACVSAGACNGLPNDNGWGQGRRPVINVSWDQAQQYTSWLSSATGQTYSLPSESQWEYTARAGDTGLFTGGSLAAICAFANGAASESGLKWANSECNDPSSDRT